MDSAGANENPDARKVAIRSVSARALSIFSLDSGVELEV
jgi:hypothetical protein